MDLNHPSGCSELSEQVGPGWASGTGELGREESGWKYGGSSGAADGGAECEWMFGGGKRLTPPPHPRAIITAPATPGSSFIRYLSGFFPQV